MSKRPAAATCEEAVLFPEVWYQVAAHDSVNGNGSVLPGIIEKMIKNVPGEFPVSADLHDLTDRSRFHVVDVPAKDLLVIITNNNLPEICVGMHPFHKFQLPFHRMSVIFRPDRKPAAEVRQALQERFDIEFSSVQRRLGLPEWTGRECGGDAVHKTTKGLATNFKLADSEGESAQDIAWTA